MIRELRVSGFKSLSNFSLNIHSGLNVLVGPNGAGKTNIIRLFDFLSYLHGNSLAEAVSRAGGAGEIFRKIGSQTIERQIIIRVRGHGSDIDHWSVRGKSRKLHLAYQLDISISFSESDNRLYYERQGISIKEYRQPPTHVRFDDVTWDVQIKYEKQSPIRTEFRSGYKGAEAIRRFIDRYKQIAAADSAEDYVLSTYLNWYIPFFAIISTDISAGNTYNIIPSRVRAPEDIAQAPVINSDGGGLAATLFQMRNTAQGARPTRGYGFRPIIFSEDAFDKVKSYFLLVNPNIADIDVKSDPYENKLKVFALVKTEDNEIEMPLGLLSDGTLKWLALVAAISTSSGLHPVRLTAS
jgi:predicted ATPase